MIMTTSNANNRLSIAAFNPNNNKILIKAHMNKTGNIKTIKVLTLSRFPKRLYNHR